MKYKIHIQEPCSESWAAMTPTEQGRFCVSCQAEVIDFTKKSDAELIQFIASGSKSCGRYRKAQLNKVYSQATKPKFWHRYLRYGLAMGLGFLSVLGYGQAPKDSLVVEQNLYKNTGNVVDNQLDTTAIIQISGVVVDSIGQPVSFCSVSWEYDGNIVGLSTDLDGRFTIELELGQNGMESVEFSCLGYETHMMLFEKSAQDITVELREEDDIDVYMLGGIISEPVLPVNERGEEGKTIFRNRRGIFGRGRKF